MTQQVASGFRPKAASILDDLHAFGTQLDEIRMDQRSNIESTSLKASESSPNSISITQGSKAIERKVFEADSLKNRIFNSAVELKVAVSQYAMHLSNEVRHKLFDDLDAVINVDDWYEEDELPRYVSFRDFLKWTIYSKRFDWLSLGVSDDGSVLLAWRKGDAVLTANFGGRGRVSWTAKTPSESGEAYAAGESPLEFFEKEARLYLGD